MVERRWSFVVSFPDLFIAGRAVRGAGFQVKTKRVDALDDKVPIRVNGVGAPFAKVYHLG
jgi:hypothetical protein